MRDLFPFLPRRIEADFDYERYGEDVGQGVSVGAVGGTGNAHRQREQVWNQQGESGV